MIEKVYEELDEAKAEIEKLRSEYWLKVNLCDELKRSHNEQVKRIQEMNMKLEKQAQEVAAKADEIYATKQSLEDIKCKLKEKEGIIKSFTSANDKLRVEFNTKLQESEEMKRELVSSLEEANVKILDLEHQNRAFLDKIEVLKEGILSVSQKKCASESKMAKASKQMRERGDMFEKLEEESVKLEEQLKWKKEQFKHLEEAHEKLRNNLRAKEKEWDMEKHAFLVGTSTLETKLDSQIRLSEDLQRQLQMRNQALAHEESLRKEANLKLEGMTNERETDVKILKNMLSEKDYVCNEMEDRIAKLEEENQELMLSLKELKASNSSSIAKLRNKLKTLEQNHKNCSDHKAREAEWRSQYEKVVSDLNFCRLELESKEALLNDYNSHILQLTMEKEESAVMVVSMRSRIDEQLEGMNCDLVKAQETIKNQHTEIKSLKKEIKNVLEGANEELGQSFWEVKEAEFELQQCKSVAEKLKANLEQIHRTRTELEASLLAQVATEVNLKEENERLVHALDEKDKRIDDLEQKLNESKNDERINSVSEIMRGMEEEFNNSTASFSSKLAKMEAEVKVFHEAWEEIRTMVVLKEVEVQEKDIMIEELEKDIENQVVFEKKCLLSMKKLSLEKENLMGIIGGVSERVNKLSREDGQLMGTLRSIVLSFDENRVSEGRKDYFDPVKENTNAYHSQSPKWKMERSPLRSLNG